MNALFKYISHTLWMFAALLIFPRARATTSSKLDSNDHSNRASVFLYTVSTPEFRQRSHFHDKSNELYAKQHKHTYVSDLSKLLGKQSNNRHLAAGSEFTDAHSYRIDIGIRLLEGKVPYDGPGHDWIVYLDGDASFVQRNIPLDLLINEANEYFANSNDTEPCQFISQDYLNTINSGFWLLRNSTWSLNLLKEWKKFVEYSKTLPRGLDTWIGDQGPLMNAVLHVSKSAVTSFPSFP
jgi:hypothetical protein